jgi:hypothetical protein
MYKPTIGNELHLVRSGGSEEVSGSLFASHASHMVWLGLHVEMNGTICGGILAGPCVCADK